MPDPYKTIRAQIVTLLSGEGAHVSFDDAIKGLPPRLRGAKPAGQPHTIWRLVEHLRIAQLDILDFSRNRNHKSPDWPDGYWPKEDAPRTARDWTNSITQFRRDLKAMQKLVLDPKTDLFAHIPHGQGQTILREAMLLIDHNAYHLGQLIMLRRVLAAWED